MNFACRYGTPDGRILDETLDGPDAATLRRELERKGCQVFEVKPKGLAIDISSWIPHRRRKRKFPAREFLAFNQELAALLRAGLPLLQALDLMLERLENPLQREVLEEVRDRVKTGEDLSDAFASFGDLFPPLYASTLKAGERSGELEGVIRRFNRYLKLILDARKKVVSALVYPALLIGLSVSMLFVLSIFVLPNFSKFYEGLNAELPTITKITMGFALWLRGHLVHLALGSAIGGWALNRWARSESGSQKLAHLRLQLPLAGEIIRFFALSEFCRSLGTLVAGGIPLLAGLETAVGAISNSWVAARLQPVIGQVREGQPFYESLDKTKVFPHIAVDMIKVGEATGSLDEMLTSVSDYFDETVETRIERMLSLLEPILLVVMGGLVSVILISIYLPMFNALSQMGGR